MSYKFTIKEKQLEEGPLEDYYNKLAKAQGAKITRSLGIQEPSNTPSGPDPRIAAYYAKKAAEKAKTDKAAAAATEKQSKDTEKQRAADQKQYARDYAGLEKQDKFDQKTAAQKVVSDAQKEIGFLRTVTQELRNTTKLQDSVLQEALDAITNQYVGRGTLTEAEADFKATPIQTSDSAKRFRSLYPDTLDANIFNNFSNDTQIINFLYLYEENLKKVQARVKQITGGKTLKINPKLTKALQLNERYLEQVTGGPAPATPAQAVAPATPAKTVAPATPAQAVAPATPAKTVAPATPAKTVAQEPQGQAVAPATPAQAVAPATPAQAVAQEPQGQAKTSTKKPQETNANQKAEDTSQTIKNGLQLVSSQLRTQLIGLCDKSDNEIVQELKSRKIMTGELFKKGPHRFIPVGEGAKWSIVIPHKKTLVKGVFSLDALFKLTGQAAAYEVEKLPVFGAGEDRFPLRADLIDKGIATATTAQQTPANSTTAQDTKISEQFAKETGPKVWQDFFNGYGGINRGSLVKLKEFFDREGINVQAKKHPNSNTLAIIEYSGQAYGFPLTSGFANVADIFESGTVNPFSKIKNMTKAAILDLITNEPKIKGYVETA